MSKKRVPSRTRRLQILENAGRIFAGQGLEGTRVKDIAEKCGINEALIFRYFGSKEDLYFESMKFFHGELGSEWEEIIAKSKSSIEAIKNVLLVRVQQAYLDKKLAAGSFNTVLSALTDERMFDLNLHLFHVAQDLIESLVRKCQIEGSIRKDLSPETVATILRSYPWFIYMTVMVGADNRLNQKMAEERFEELFAVLQPAKIVSKSAAAASKGKPSGSARSGTGRKG
jgi:AcrR family transcriptional regulator